MTKWPQCSVPNIKSIDTISVRPLTAESIKKNVTIPQEKRQHRRIKRYAFSVDLHSSRMWTSDPQRSESGTKKDFSMYAYEVDQLTHMWTHKMICFLVSSSWQTIYGTGYFQVCKEKHCFFKWIFQLHWIDCISLPKTHRDAWETNWAKKFWCRKKVATFAVWEQSNVTKS